jgi:hypothetical protein
MEIKELLQAIEGKLDVSEVKGIAYLDNITGGIGKILHDLTYGKKPD